MLERDLSLAGSLTEPRLCVPELLSTKMKRQISSKDYLYLLLKVTVRIFPPIKVRKSPPLDSPTFNEDALHIPRRQECVSDRRRGSGTDR